MQSIAAVSPQILNIPSATSIPLQKNALPSTLFLDGLRGLAALYVLLRHVTWLYTPSSASPIWREIYRTLEHFFFYGHMAVIFFFVLSGFVIHLRYARQLHDHPDDAKLGWGSFVFRRARRLYPPLLAAVLITSIFDRASGALSLPNYYISRGEEFAFLRPAILFNHEPLTFLGNFAFLMQMHVPVWGSDSPLWSLAYEWWFYMLYPLLWQLTRRSIWLASGVVLVGLLITRLPGNWPLIQDGTYPFSGWNMFSLPRRILGALPAWWCGVLLADVYSGRIRISFKNLSWLTFALGAMFFRHLPEVHKALAAGIGFCGVISFGFYLQERNFPLAFFNKLKFLGDFSYTLYVTHLPVIIFLTPFWTLRVRGKFAGAAPLGLLVITIVPLIIAYLVHLVAEVPFTRSHKPKPMK